MQNRLKAALLAAATASLMWAASTEGGRLEWEMQTATPVWHRSCAFSHLDAKSDPDHRFAVLHGSLTSLARGDAALYAVFLETAEELHALEQILATANWPSEAPENGLSLEWLPLQANGEITVYADEAHQPGMNWVVVVNGAGEILGGRTLWTHDGDLALRTDTDN